MTAHGSTGAIPLVGLIIAGIFVGGLLLAGLIETPNFGTSNRSADAISCCDTGNGDKCQAQSDKTITYQDDTYGLIKSNVKIEDPYHFKGVHYYGIHLKDSGEKTDHGDPIVINTSKQYAEHNLSENIRRNIIGGPDGKMCANYKLSEIKGDVLGYISGDDDESFDYKECIQVPTGEIVYVCKENCSLPNPPPSYCGSGIDMTINAEDGGIYQGDCYGNKDSLYDVYFRMKDIPNPGIPDLIKNCSHYLPHLLTPAPAKQTVVEPTHDSGKPNLQLNTFDIKYDSTATWFAPLCKPAIYLYPPVKTQVNVSIAPKGNLTITIPSYTPGGWNVIASPDGTISYQNKTYPYLYYEAQIPDTLIEKPHQGYVIEQKSLSHFLPQLLSKLGLNEKERNEFTTYWIQALPDSPYYFVGILSKDNLDAIAPLSISPPPQTMIRVTLYFEPLTQKKTVKQPMESIIQRTGFTAVEWGGVVKLHNGASFSCLM